MTEYTPAKLAELLAVEAAATPGPWTPFAHLNVRAPDPRGGTRCPLTSSGLEFEERKANFEFISAAREHFRPLLERELERLKQDDDPGGYLAVGGFVRRITELEEQVQRLTAMYAPFKPMSTEEAEAALDAIEAEPMSAEAIEDAVKYATDPEHRERSLRKRGDELSRICRGQRVEIERLTAENDRLKQDAERTSRTTHSTITVSATIPDELGAAIDAARKGE